MDPLLHQRKPKNLTEALDYAFACNFERVLLHITRTDHDGHKNIALKIKALRANQRDILADAVQRDRDISNPEALNHNGGHLLFVVTADQFADPAFRANMAVWDRLIHPEGP